MTAIWQNDESGWRLSAPSRFPDEKTLHELVEKAPQILPLAGSPGLVVVGREVLLGNNYADLIAIEPSGRLAIIEVKLARNAEARRAVIAQVLTYAAYLRGMDPSVLEQQVLGRHLRDRGWSSLADAVAGNDQEGAFVAAGFAEELADSLARGRFRLILVLDEAPEELVRLVGYLQAVGDTLLIDLITVAAYDINGQQAIVPQRVEPEQRRTEPRTDQREERRASPLTRSPGVETEGGDAFRESIGEAPPENQPTLRMLHEWAVSLERAGIVRLRTRHDTARQLWTLRPLLRSDDAGLVTIWNERTASLTPWRSVFERRAPVSLPRVERIVAPAKVGTGNTIRDITPELLDALTQAYREAALGEVSIVEGGEAGTGADGPERG